MQLSEHDLKQLDEQIIRSLQADRLRTLSLKLLADLKEAHDRLNQSPDNSSRPPSTRAPWQGADTEPRDDSEAEERKPEEAGQDIEEGLQENEPSTGQEVKKGSEQEQTAKPTKKPPGKPGKPKGAQGHGRTVELAIGGCCWSSKMDNFAPPDTRRSTLVPISSTRNGVLATRRIEKAAA